jgi:MFS family permease
MRLLNPTSFRVRHTRFQSLRNRNFRIYFIGQAVSATGTWMQKIAQAWLVLELTDSGVMLGVAVALQQLPTLLITPWAGALADRSDKRKLIMIAEGVAGALALLLAILTVTNRVELWMVLVLALGLGLADAFDRPARKSFVIEMVEDDQVTNAITLSAVVMNAARTVGPAIAGILIASVGLSTSFFINAASYLAVVGGLAIMREGDLVRSIPTARVGGQVREGLSYVAKTPTLVGPIVLMAIAGLFAFEWNVTLPLLARDAFSDDPQTFGLLFSAIGVGAVIGGIGLASMLEARLKLMLAASFTFGSLMFLVAGAPNLILALVALVFLGAASITFKTQVQSIAQLRAAPNMRGRVAAIATVATAGTSPIGAPLIGWIGETYGARSTFVVGGVATILAAAWTARYLSRRGALADEAESRTLTGIP